MKLLKEDMLAKRKKNLDVMIEDLEHAMIGADPDSEEYQTLLQRYDKLMHLKRDAKSKVDPNTMLLVGGNLLGIIAILVYEKSGIVTTKALGFILKPKIFGK